MAIPTNLLTINTSIVEEATEAATTVQQVAQAKVPSNLLPVNASEISASFQSLAGQLPTELNIEIPQYSLLNQAIPDSLFTTGSFDRIRDTTISRAQSAVNALRVTRPVFSISTTVPQFSPKLPSFGQIKNFINTKIDRIKRQRQQASIRALKEELKQQENPFTYRKMLVNKAQKNTVLNSINQIRGQ